MDLLLRQSGTSDLAFMQEMLFEAVFWRTIDEAPELEVALSLPFVSIVLEDWGERPGDTAIIATKGEIPIGAAWYRYWDDENNTRGYYDPAVPVIVIGVAEAYRGQGIGTQLLEALCQRAATQKVSWVSLAVSKDNPALGLYQKSGFAKFIDRGDWLIMLREITK